MGVSDKVLKQKVETVIKKLEEPVTVNCQAHGPLAEGVKVLLEIQAAILDGKLLDDIISKRNVESIQVGNFKITGVFAVFTVAFGYVLLKLHGVI